MKKKEINADSEDRYFFDTIDRQIPAIDTEKPVVIFIDGVGTTRDRDSHNLLAPAFGDAMLSAARAMCSGIPCHIFQISDEVSVIIRDIKAFADKVGASYCTHDELSAAAIQHFTPAFCRAYKMNVYFHVRVHNIEASDCERYIDWRRKYVRKAVLTYYAIKTGVWRSDYGSLGGEEIVRILKSYGFCSELKKIRRYIEGTRWDL